jgi:hypothetical protein
MKGLSCMIRDLGELIDKFDVWYKNDEHSTNEDYYKDKINKSYLQNLNREPFIDFFYDFKAEGGKLQSGGERSKNEFKKMVENNYESFREYVLEPFNENFNLSNWLTRIKKYEYFGEGAATIYLNRVNKHKYCVKNNKTADALEMFGVKSKGPITESYFQVLHFQEQLIKKYPILNNFYKADALNHYIIAIDEGKELIERLRNNSQNILSSIQPSKNMNDTMLLQTKKQIILYGPPGTGKTYHTKMMAVSFISGIDYERDLIEYDELSDTDSKEEKKEVTNPLFNKIESFVKTLSGIEAIPRSSMIGYYSYSKILNKKIGLVWLAYPARTTGFFPVHFRKEVGDTKYPQEAVNQITNYRQNGWGGYPSFVVKNDRDAEKAITLIKYGYEKL